MQEPRHERLAKAIERLTSGEDRSPANVEVIANVVDQIFRFGTETWEEEAIVDDLDCLIDLFGPQDMDCLGIFIRMARDKGKGDADDSWARSWALAAIVRIGSASEEGKAALDELAKDADPEVRRDAVSALLRPAAGGVWAKWRAWLGGTR